MKKRLLSLILVFVMVVTLLPITTQAAGVSVMISGHSAGNLKNEIDDYMTANGILNYSDIESLTVAGGTLDNADRVFLYSSTIYSTLDALDISETSIDYSGDITSGYFKAANPNELPQYAFGNWNALTWIALPENVTFIDSFALNCSTLKTVYLPKDLASIKSAAFGIYHYSVREVYTDSTTPPSSMNPNAFMGLAEGAVLYVPKGSESDWDSKDQQSNDCKVYQLYIENLAPVITHDHTRISDTTAEVNICSNEPGTCYYEVVKDGEPAPDIDTTTGGESFDSLHRLSLNFTGLEPVAYDIYLKAKDKLGNVTEMVKIDLEVYVEAFDLIINDHEAGKLWDEVSEYLDSLGMSGKFEKILSLELSGAAMNDDDWYFFQNAYQMAYSVQTIDLSGVISNSIPEDSLADYDINEIYLPAGVESIGAEAFMDCDNLSDITLPAATPPAVGEDAFDGIAANAEVHIPFGSAAAYRAVDDGDTGDNLWYGLIIDEEKETVLPFVTRVSPSGKSVSRSGNIAVTFSEQMDTTVIGAVYLSDDGGSTYKFTLEGKSWTVGDTVCTAPYSGLAYSRKYTVVISGFKDLAGNKLLTDSSHSFTTKAKSTSGGRNGSSGGGSSSGGNTTAAGNTTTSGNISNTENNKTEAAGDDRSTVNPFKDVDKDAWYYGSVMYVYNKGIMSGMGQDNFNPAGSMTRAMLVAVLHRLDGKSGGYMNTFSDIVPGAWYEQAAAWAVSNRITKGVGSNSFAPEASLTREQLAVMLYNYATYKGFNVTAIGSSALDSYTDTDDISKWANDAMKWAVSTGIITGDGASLNSKAIAKRAEVAAMLQRFIESLIDK